jgi:hypothetical protein
MLRDAQRQAAEIREDKKDIETKISRRKKRTGERTSHGHQESTATSARERGVQPGESTSFTHHAVPLGDIAEPCSRPLAVQYKHIYKSFT